MKRILLGFLLLSGRTASAGSADTIANLLVYEKNGDGIFCQKDGMFSLSKSDNNDRRNIIGKSAQVICNFCPDDLKCGVIDDREVWVILPQDEQSIILIPSSYSAVKSRSLPCGKPENCKEFIVRASSGQESKLCFPASSSKKVVCN